MNDYNCPHCGESITAIKTEEPPVTEWIRNHPEGWGWRYLDDGRILAEHPAQASANLVSTSHEDGYLYRTNGYPSSMERLFDDFGLEITEAASFYEIGEVDIMAVIGVEATRLPNNLFDAQCVREEPGYVSDSATPNKVSPGLMQTLLSTYTDMEPGIPMVALGASVDRYDLFQPRRSILAGTSYMRHQYNKEPDRVKAFVGGYNAGSARQEDPDDPDSSPWLLVTYGPHRVDEYIAWVNDAVSLDV